MTLKERKTRLNNLADIGLMLKYRLKTHTSDALARSLDASRKNIFFKLSPTVQRNRSKSA